MRDSAAVQADGDTGLGEQDATPLQTPVLVTAMRPAVQAVSMPPAEGRTPTRRIREAVRS
ncbi:hypothetical protein QF030_007663 [Streptomyces rishiriensis]|uniref:Uncharacterized protein n=1 Tax=Streptomyces rishiriensis TaxID=68264 RepID=A0ABU0P262_STRRH|nr:hypothetical protein [Streptomyces rishiriensis]